MKKNVRSLLGEALLRVFVALSLSFSFASATALFDDVKVQRPVYMP